MTARCKREPPTRPRTRSFRAEGILPHGRVWLSHGPGEKPVEEVAAVGKALLGSNPDSAQYGDVLRYLTSHALGYVHYPDFGLNPKGEASKSGPLTVVSDSMSSWGNSPTIDVFASALASLSRNVATNGLSVGDFLLWLEQVQPWENGVQRTNEQEMGSFCDRLDKRVIIDQGTVPVHLGPEPGGIWCYLIDSKADPNVKVVVSVPDSYPMKFVAEGITVTPQVPVQHWHPR